MQRFTSHLRGQEENGLYRAQSKKEKTEIGFERIIRALFGIVNDSSHRIFSSGVRVFVHPTDSSFCSDLSTNKVEQATLSRLFSFCSVALDGSNGATAAILRFCFAKGIIGIRVFMLVEPLVGDT